MYTCIHCEYYRYGSPRCTKNPNYKHSLPVSTAKESFCSLFKISDYYVKYPEEIKTNKTTKEIKTMKFIIDTTYSKRDISGNVYNYSTITNIETNKSASYNGGWGSNDNLICYFRRLGYESNQLYRSEATIGIRDFNRQSKTLPYIHNEQDLTKALEALL